VDIEVHQCGVDVDEDRRGREKSAVLNIAIGVFYRLDQGILLNSAVVDKDPDEAPIATDDRRFRGDDSEGEPLTTARHVVETLHRDGRPEYRPHSLDKRMHRQDPGLPGAGGVGEADGRKGERLVEDHVADRLTLRLGAGKETASSGKIGKKLTYLDDRTGNGRRGARLGSLGMTHPESGPGCVSRAIRPDLQVADGSDTREGLTAESKGSTGIEILDGSNLARRVGMPAEFEVLSGHASAIVVDPDQLHASAFPGYVDRTRRRVETVVEQLPDDRGGALDYLPRGDPPGDFRWQERHRTR
jgi:hypothetical protein